MGGCIRFQVANRREKHYKPLKSIFGLSNHRLRDKEKTLWNARNVRRKWTWYGTDAKFTGAAGNAALIIRWRIFAKPLRKKWRNSSLSAGWIAYRQVILVRICLDSSLLRELSSHQDATAGDWDWG